MVCPVCYSTSFNNFTAFNPPPWFDEYQIKSTERDQFKPVRVTIKRDRKVILSDELPVISVANMRSLHPKLNNFQDDLREREISLSLLCEVWDKGTCKKQKARIEEMCQMKGYKYISTPRTNKRGGGAAIIVDLRKYSLNKIDEVSNPDKVETVEAKI